MNILEKLSQELKKYCVRLHGAALISGGEVVDEIYLPPYTRDTKTRLYSTTKSVAAIAIGKLVGEGKISLDDKVVDIFADRFDMTNAHPLLREQTVRQMLTMTTVYSNPTYGANTREWLASYFKAEPTHPAGTLWHYDSCGSYVIGAITKHVTGMDFIEYLRPEFDEIGVSEGVYCLEGPDGEAWASSGFIATTEDLGRIAYLMLKHGKWGDKQLIPEDFATDAISPLAINTDRAIFSRYDCGYGYQIWSHPDGAFAFRGLGGQIAIGYPGRDLVFVCTSDTSGNHNAYDDIFRAVEEIVLPHFPIINEREHEKMLPKPVNSTEYSEIVNKTYILNDNPLNIESIRIEDKGDGAILQYIKGGKEYTLPFTIGYESVTTFPEGYHAMRVFDDSAKACYRCSVIGEWTEPRKLRIRVWAEDIYVGNLTLVFAFREDGTIAIKADKNAQFFFDDFVGCAWGKQQ